MLLAKGKAWLCFLWTFGQCQCEEYSQLAQHVSCGLGHDVEHNKDHETSGNGHSSSTDKAVPLVINTHSYWDSHLGCWISSQGDPIDLQLHHSGMCTLLNANCPGGIALESWYGSEDAKSVLAGEMSTLNTSFRRSFSSEFIFGHEVSTCSAGIFISSHPIMHPRLPEVCVFQMNMRAQHPLTFSGEQAEVLMAAFTYLTSSVWILHSKSQVDLHELDRLTIVTKFAKHVAWSSHSWPPQPVMHWIMQNVHRAPMQEEKHLKRLLLKYDETLHTRRDAKQAAQMRNSIRESLQHSFLTPINISVLPFAFSDPNIPLHLHGISRNHPSITAQFVTKVDHLRQELLLSAAPLKMQHNGQALIADGTTVVDFMRDILRLLKEEELVPMQELTHSLILVQINRTKAWLLNAWQSCMNASLTRSIDKHKDELLVRIHSFIETERHVSVQILTKNVTEFISNNVPVRQDDLLLLHNECYDTAVQQVPQLPAQEVRNAGGLVGKNASELTLMSVLREGDTEIFQWFAKSSVPTANYNDQLLAVLWETQLSQLRTNFTYLDHAEAAEMVRIVDKLYTALSIGPNAVQQYTARKPQFMRDVDFCISVGTEFQKMRSVHAAEMRQVNDRHSFPWHSLSLNIHLILCIMISLPLLKRLCGKIFQEQRCMKTSLEVLQDRVLRLEWPEHIAPASGSDFRMVYSREANAPLADISPEWALYDSSEAPTNDSLSQASHAFTAPSLLTSRQCLMPGCQALAPKGVVKVAPGSCFTGQIFRSGCNGLSGTSVSRCEELTERDRDVTTIVYQTEDGVKQLNFTANHALNVMRPGAAGFGPLPAGDINVDDRLRTLSSEAKVLKCTTNVLTTSCIEVELANQSSTMYVSKAGEPQTSCIQVFGELAPRPTDDFVKLLRFRHFKNIRESLLKSPELRACREELEQSGFSADLEEVDKKEQNSLKRIGLSEPSAKKIGPGKMFVHSSIASQVIEALRNRAEQLMPRDVVVSKAYEKAVLDAVCHQQGTRANWVRHEQPLDLSRTTYLWLDNDELHLRSAIDAAYEVVTVKRTFIDVRYVPASGSRSSSSAPAQL